MGQAASVDLQKSSSSPDEADGGIVESTYQVYTDQPKTSDLPRQLSKDESIKETADFQSDSQIADINIVGKSSEEKVTDAKSSFGRFYHKPAYEGTNLHRGLLNPIGGNNCFLNVTIQALWHLGPFRIGFRHLIMEMQLRRHRLSELSIVDAICNLFINYEYAESSVIPPTELRQKLSHLSDKFKLGDIADANEVLDFILNRIHSDTTPSCPGHDGKCLSHVVFGGVILEQATCKACSCTNEPVLRNDFLHCVYAMEVIDKCNQLKAEIQNAKSDALGITASAISIALNSTLLGNGERKNLSTGSGPVTFGSVLQRCLGVDLLSCPSLQDAESPQAVSSIKTLKMKYLSDPYPPTVLPTDGCQGRASVKFHCLEAPLALAISVVWTQPNESPETIRDFMEVIDETIDLSEVFDTGGATAHAAALPFLTPRLSAAASALERPSYVFRGLVCYYGLHYVSMFQEYSNSAASSGSGGEMPGQFLLFDDQRIRTIGDLQALKAECVKSRYQPVLLLYELESSGRQLSFRESAIEDSRSEKIQTLSHVNTHTADVDVNVDVDVPHKFVKMQPELRQPVHRSLRVNPIEQPDDHHHPHHHHHHHHLLQQEKQQQQQQHPHQQQRDVQPVGNWVKPTEIKHNATSQSNPEAEQRTTVTASFTATDTKSSINYGDYVFDDDDDGALLPGL